MFHLAASGMQYKTLQTNTLGLGELTWRKPPEWTHPLSIVSTTDTPHLLLNSNRYDNRVATTTYEE